jgi:N-acetylmuramoyl-L-alanine amidase
VPEEPGRKITAIVIHYTGSNHMEGTVAWFKNPKAKVSAHYVIGQDGRVVQMVRDHDIAWHAGQSAMRPDLPDGHPNKEKNVNRFSIGIELVGTADSGFTDLQLASLYTILEVLVTRYRILPDRVVGHSTVAPGRKIDPEGFHGQFNWAKTRAVAQVAYSAVTKVLPHA